MAFPASLFGRVAKALIFQNGLIIIRRDCYTVTICVVNLLKKIYAKLAKKVLKKNEDAPDI